LQVGSYLRSVLVSKVSIFLQTFVDDPFQFGGEVGIQSHGRRGSRVENGFEDDS
jgi:hypothetical protein